MLFSLRIRLNSERCPSLLLVVTREQEHDVGAEFPLFHGGIASQLLKHLHDPVWRDELIHAQNVEDELVREREPWEK